MELRPVDVVFEGGGVKGIGLAGAYLELYAAGYRPECVAGTSAGAITASLVAAGYTGEELRRLVLEDMHFALFADRRRLAWLGAIGEAIDVVKDKGLHSGSYFLRWIRELLEAKGVRTFADLRDDRAIRPDRRYRLQVIASDLTDHAMLVLPRDAPRLGIDPDELRVADAVRMSMSIPIFFDPVIRRDRGDRRRHLVVDGGMLSNFPIWLLDAPPGTAPRFPTFGMLLVAPNQADPLLPGRPAGPASARLPSLFGYVRAIAETMMQAHDRLYVEQVNYARTIAIPTLGVGTTEFDISAARAGELFESGRTAAASFLETWDFEDYLARFRRAAPPPHRARLEGARAGHAGGARQEGAQHGAVEPS
jgi:NTE family protein